MMNNLFRDYISVFMIPYMDDILVYLHSVAEHSRHLRAVLQHLRDNKLYSKLDKCVFFRDKIDFIGHTLSAEGIKPVAAKINVIKQWPTPTNVTKLRQFLSLANYYHAHVPHFTHTAAPLYDLMKADVEWQWQPQHQQAVDVLKSALGNAITLAPVSSGGKFLLHTDASDTGIGAMLEQQQQPGQRLCIIGFFS